MAELGRVTDDMQWLFHMGVVYIIDKLIVYTKSAMVIRRIRYIFFVAGRSPLVQSIVAFTTLDYTFMLGLGRLDIAELRQLCTLDEEDMADAPVSGGIGGSLGDGGAGGGPANGGAGCSLVPDVGGGQKGHDSVGPNGVQAG
ncbi:unnamed protein product [Lactuca virosa]|uniref:Uncharacterized protein n=1 Tax=Lactuca virosa TaxID=75947 RepID=A0AAU9M5N7_9ASTR|nr:unnamed protein product [Lactuca virosa]